MVATSQEKFGQFVASLTSTTPVGADSIPLIRNSITYRAPGSAFAPSADPIFTGTIQGVTINISGREFVGTPGATWLANIPSWLYIADTSQALVISTRGTLSVAGAVRSIDQGPGGASIGVAGVALNNVSGASDAWGGYFEGRREPGNTGITQGIEADATNNGSLVDVTSWSLPAGSTIAVLAAAGGGISPANPTAAGVVVSGNTQVHRRGIVVLTNALDASLGSGGDGIAMEMAYGQTVRWLASNGTTYAEIWTDVTGLHIKGPSGTVTNFP